MTARMPRAQAVLDCAPFRERLDAIDAAEAARPFCRHGLAHLLDVARVACMGALERGVPVDRELVYTAALLHDIGRAEQYECGEDHDAAGARIAAEILDALPEGCAFTEGERASILAAVVGHRGAPDADARHADGLASLIRWADGASRPCFACTARDACYWPDERKNLTIDW